MGAFRDGWRRGLRRDVFLWMAATVAILGLLTVGPGQDLLRRLDREVLHERLKESLARLLGKEDWAVPKPFRQHQDYVWLKGGWPVRIAHALGEPGTSTANTLGAMRRSYEAGFRLFEVDLVLEDGELKCRHDPGPPPAAMAQDGCTLETLLVALPTDAWLVLDLKTDFQATGERSLEAARRYDKLSQLIFQLYKPGDVDLFAAWQSEAPALPGPIVTTYLAHRSLDHIVMHARRIGLQVLTLPRARLPALRDDRQGLRVLVHPIHSCADATVAARYRVDGIYTLHSLSCRP